jgi:AmiR/NasT family two-component response regulator
MDEPFALETTTLEPPRDGQAPTYAQLAAQVAHLRAALRSRPVIEQAKGILIARTGCDPERAFQLLVTQSQYENRKLRDVAAELVQRTVRRPTDPSTD